MIVKNLDGLIAIIYKEPSPGFNRGVSLEYMAFTPEKALEVGWELVRLGREAVNAKDTGEDKAPA